MRTLLDYVEENGTKSFKEKEYNELDSLVLGILSYLDLGGIVPKDHKKITMEKAIEKFYKRYSNNDVFKLHGTGLRSAYNIICTIRKSIRYKDLLLYNYDYQSHDDLQFSAVCIDIDDKTTYISFEGTDDLVSGWREDCEAAYMFPTNSQELAIKYVNNHIQLFSNRSYILGGHSKGGNLALVAGMYSNILVRHKIKKIYSFDGPGLRNNELHTWNYRSIRKKFEHIIPDYSIIGLFMRNDGNYRVVKSSVKGLLAHDANNWVVENDHLVNAKLSKSSKKLDKHLKLWLDKYSLEEREFFVHEVFDIFDRLGIKNFVEVKANMGPKMLKILKERKNMDKKAKKMLGDLILAIFQSIFVKN
jgi:hypothetical protein